MTEELRRRLEDVRRRIGEACRRSGRSPEDVRIIAVTKKVPLEKVQQAVSLGIKDLGENRIPEGAVRKPSLAPGLCWHMIGHVQTNKIRRLLEWCDVLHSLDRAPLAEELGRHLAPSGRRLPAYVQVNVSGEESKGGVRPGEVEGWIRDLRRDSPLLEIRGLMTMAPLGAPESGLRAMFRSLRELAGRCGLDRLSMGMSGDFEIAVEEGATDVRIGTALFGP